MEFLDRLTDAQTWEQFYRSCELKDFMSVRELRELRRILDAGECRQEITQWLGGQWHFPNASRKIINKLSSGKKRVVYTFEPTQRTILKVLAWHLHEYDRIFTPNLYSFRVNSGVKKAVAYLRNQPRLSLRYVYKVDIHDYFNSVNVDKVLAMLRGVLTEEPKLCSLIEEILTNPCVNDDGKVICEERGIMAGMPISSFLANLYLSGMDRAMHEQGVLYARYADDIIVFADTAEELAERKEFILGTLAEYGLTVNPAKEFTAAPREPWTFLGVTYCDGVVDVSEASVTKLKGKMKRRARKVYRWKCRNHVADEAAIRVYIDHFNRKFYETDSSSELTWGRWFFPVITRSDSLAVLDRYMVECIRYIATGRYTKANYRLRYEDIKRLGFRSLVHEYYLGSGKESAGEGKEQA